MCAWEFSEFAELSNISARGQSVGRIFLFLLQRSKFSIVPREQTLNKRLCSPGTYDSGWRGFAGVEEWLFQCAGDSETALFERTFRRDSVYGRFFKTLWRSTAGRGNDQWVSRNESRARSTGKRRRPPVFSKRAPGGVTPPLSRNRHQPATLQIAMDPIPLCVMLQ